MSCERIPVHCAHCGVKMDVLYDPYIKLGVRGMCPNCQNVTFVKLIVRAVRDAVECPVCGKTIYYVDGGYVTHGMVNPCCQMAIEKHKQEHARDSMAKELGI